MTAVKWSFRWRLRIRWWMVLTRIGSRPVVGSSKKTIWGSVMSARAIATRLRMPPETSAGYLAPMPSSPTWASPASTRFATSVPGRCSFSRSGNATLSAHVIESNSSTPSTSTRPPSGRRRPIRCLRRTVLHPPLRPMMTVIEPVATSRSTSCSTCCPSNHLTSRSTLISDSPRLRLRLALPRSREHRAHEVVPDQDEHGGQDDRVGGRLGDALCAVAHVEALVGADPRDEHAERERLPEPHHDVVEIDEGLHLAEIGALGEPEELDADEVASEDADRVEDRGHERERHETGQDGGRDEIADRVQRHDRERVDLLGDAHDADLGRECRPRASRHHERRQHRAELPDEGERDGGPEVRLGPEADEREIHLEAEHHAREPAGQQDDQQRSVPDVVDPVDERPEFERRGQERPERLRQEHPEAAQRLDDRDRPPPDRIQRTQHQRERPLRHAWTRR